MFPAAREGDPITHDSVSPSGVIGPPIVPCDPTMGPVLIEGLPAAHVGSTVLCTGATSLGPAHPPPPPGVPPPTILVGSPTVFIHGLPAARWIPSGDAAACGVFLGDAKLVAARTVFIGNGSPSKTITFSPELSAVFDQLWTDSFPGGRAMEHGGVLVTDGSGAMTLVGAGAGLSPAAGSFQPDLTASPGQTVKGVFHTHPYDATEGGHTNVSLSGADAAYMINNGHEMIVAKSGPGIFVLKRTPETPASVDYRQVDDDQNARIWELTSSGKTFPEASRQATKETADRLHLKYYEGTNDTATEVE